jgi:hypothetical protein
MDEADEQEFVDARRLQSLQSAPQVTYSNREPPLEIRNVPGLKNGEDWGYVTFSESLFSPPFYSVSSYFVMVANNSPRTKTFREPCSSHIHNQPYPAIPRLPPLPHQVL